MTMTFRTSIALVVITLILCISTALAGAKLPGRRDHYFHAVAWVYQGRVTLAIANTSSSHEELTTAFGYYLLGQRIIDEFSVTVPPKTILITTYPVIRGDSPRGYVTADTIFIHDENDQQIGMTQIIGIHPATTHYQVDRYLVPAGEEAIAYLETPDPELGIDAKIYLSIGKTYRLGDRMGKLVVDKVHRGGLERATKPPLSDLEDPKDFHNYSYGWRGLAIKISTPKIRGVERIDFDIEKFISTPEGTARHGLSAPPILVYGPDMILMEE